MTELSNRTENLFSYGTLQLEPVQRSTFGRLLDGRQDSLPGYKLTMLEIRDAAVVATSGKKHHPIVGFTGDPGDQIQGTVFAITPEELRHADAYEVDDYRRDQVVLQSGVSAWVYVGKSSPKPAT
jgi:gamma-glutamylcyclotransferase (GGCT)/AIG2-like uncharacterized protein YtfP